MKMTITVGLAWVLMLVCSAAVSAKDESASTASVVDAIEMTRIQHEAGADGAVAAISPDGTQAAFVTWRGDMARNTNAYELRLLDLRAPLQSRPSKTLLTRLYPGDRHDQQASPIKQLRFVQQGKALAYLGLDGSAVAQAYVVEIATGKERQLTKHPSSVRNFVLDAKGGLLAYSAVAYPQDETSRRVEEHGVFLWDSAMFPDYRASFPAGSILARQGGWKGIRQYFLAGNSPKLIFDSRQSRPAEQSAPNDPKAAVSPSQSLMDDMVLGFAALSADPSGKQFLLYPYQVTEHPMHPERYQYYRAPNMNSYARRVAPQVALVDAATGKISPLIDAPSPQFERYESGAPLWSADGRSVLMYTLFSDKPDVPPAWVEVELASRRVVSLGLEKDWKPVGWASDGKSLVLSNKGERFALLHRGDDGRWLKPQNSGSIKGLNPDWSAVTDGAVVLGVKDGLRQAPELAAYDLHAGKEQLLTDLNPQLRQRRLGEVSGLHWRDPPSTEAEGFLVKPVGFQAGKRYPLVVLLDDGTLRREGDPYFLDAAWQLSGHAAQMLAAQGFMVLYHREPPLRDVIETPEEPRRMQRDIEAAVAKLDQEGLIDKARIGISGWSRAGFYTSYLLIHSSLHFAAATNIDGGASEYTDRMRPFTDDELKQISGPVMFESHGLWSLVYHSAMAERMTALGVPNEILYFDAASHSTTRPQHRLRSLQTNIDWWRFWLQDQIDPEPAKATQYAHWQQLREAEQARKPKS